MGVSVTFSGGALDGLQLTNRASVASIARTLYRDLLSGIDKDASVPATFGGFLKVGDVANLDVSDAASWFMCHE